VTPTAATTFTTPGLDLGQRSTLERLVIRARVLLESDLATLAEGRYGIHLDGTFEDGATLPDATDRLTRGDLAEIVAHLTTLGEDAPGAVARLLREAAFTHLNRLVAVRIAEAIGLLPESLANGPQSRGFRDLGEIMPLLASNYRAYIRLCGDELAADVPALFDPRNPLLALEPSTAVFDDLVALFADPDAIGIWAAPDTLGWAYQFFNTADERRAMRDAGGPRTSRELAVRNQFFTPRYVVDFLVQNTLGRRLVEDDPTSPILKELPLLLNPPIERGPSLDLDDIKCLDPACGSGHFLLGCYDVLERAWELAGVPASESAPKIVASLWGVDIDPRCAQVASAAIVFRARRSCRDLVLPRPNIITARGLPGGSDALPPHLDLTPEQRHLVDRVSEVLDQAPLLGTLLRAEDALDREIRHGLFGGVPGTLPLTDAAAEATERELLTHLKAVADQASSSVAERLLAAEADDALRLIDVVRQRYDVVLMNPPFGEPVPITKTYLRTAYPWIPTRDYNLLAAFVGRGLELCKADGYLGALTSRAGMFLTTFEKWRREIFIGNRLTSLVDLGYGVMEQAMVEAAAYVIGRGKPPSDHEGTFVRLLKDVDRGAALREAIGADRAKLEDHRVYHVLTSDFDAIPGAPIAYWMSRSLRRLFSELPQLEGSGAEARQGLATGDDFRFVRTFWEVDPRSIGRSVAETMAGRNWCPFAKGGDYSPYWYDIHLVVNYGPDGQVLRDFPGSVIRNPQYYFRSGVTWPERTASGFGPRLLPAGCVFSHVGHGAFALADAWSLLGVMNTRLFATLLSAFLAAGEEATSGSPAKRYSVGSVQRTPWLGHLLTDEGLSGVASHVSVVCAAIELADRADETARRFTAPAMMASGNQSLQATAAERVDALETAAIAAIESSIQIESSIHRACDVSEDTLEQIDDEWGQHPAAYPSIPLDPSEALEFTSLYSAPTDELVDRLVALRGASKSITLQNYVADRRLEILSHAFARHPRTLQDTRRTLGLLPPEEPKRSANEILSYLVGAALGRWDVRIARNPALAPAMPALVDLVPLCPPGMLLDSDGFPATGAPAGYPLELPPSRLLVDEPGHRWDIEAAVLQAVGALFDDPIAIVAGLLEILGQKTIRDYLRRQFFKDHLSRYTKSRRKAPIYWPLTVPSKNWGIWVYAPMLNREALYAVAGEAGRRERLAGEAIARLQREQREGGAGRPVGKVVAELDAEELLAEELRRFRTEAERVAGLGWGPNLDDGIILCAAPLADLFPAWPDAKAALMELRSGEYSWATVAAWADKL